ncbi:fimbria/pilus periplasmic chaperone [Providencia huaxiensis]|nr:MULTISPECIES: fimbria/pilus periplasmic chaperone [Providencia]MBQ0533784.1 fimbria/pilus periplasmic chaperone [Providencia huaxiensis]MBQ0588478.1 fimbria/pilus periplasmic chaperone [Providencia huaxiensis]MCD2527862.1 fimbria/pilus periplasmic chaperone [Providencia huaxiensis]MCG9535060.1 fimbria/pilus periplasmic chaperone [Providencia huaxiensis]MDI7239258.1 fimbria/pilus periplasmic chaperone [Providencia huaxiensis]
MKKISVFLLSSLMAAQAYSAISMDRTRIIFDGNNNSVSLTVSNKNPQLPYLAQGWLQDAKGDKLTSYFTILPPIQRINAGQTSQLRIESLPDIGKLPQDRESLFFFNLREIPPTSKKSNVLQIALQTRVKLFYRPASLVMDSTEMRNSPWQNKLILIKKSDGVYAKNPTPYFIILNSIKKSQSAEKLAGFTVTDVEPFAEKKLSISADQLGTAPIINYINDYGGQVYLPYNCSATQCQTQQIK